MSLVRADAAAATRERLLSPDDQKIVRQNREDKAGREIDEAGRMVGIASVAVYAGRNESAKKLLDTNEKILEAQKKIVDAMEDSEEKARRQESIGNHLSQIDTARARMKQGEAKTEEERTQALADKLKEVESQIKELTDAPAKIKIEADIQQAIDGINTTLVALGQLQDKTVTVTVKTVQEGGGSSTSGTGAPTSSMPAWCPWCATRRARSVSPLSTCPARRGTTRTTSPRWRPPR